jgi:hypothetical protein
MKTIKEYYNSDIILRKILESVESPGMRIWKVEYTDGSFTQNSKKINSVEKLRELLFWGDRLPSKVYVSVAKYLNPHKVFGKKASRAVWVIADTLFMKSDLLFDLDSKKDLNIAFNEAKRIINFMKYEEDYELKNIRFSGKKGFHLLYRDNNPIKEPNPILRLNMTEDRRLKLVDRMPELKTIDNIHKQIIADQFRVHAALGTIKAETGYEVKEIPEYIFINKPLDYIKKHYIHRVVRPHRSMIADEHILTSKSGEERTTLSSNPFFYYFVDNMVRGIKDMYIPVLKYPKGKADLKKLKKLQEKYNLSKFFVLLYNNVWTFICCRVVDEKRLDKIMKDAKPMNLKSWLHYKHAWIPISEAKDIHGKILWKPQLLGTLESGIVKGPHSRPHANLFKAKYEEMIGAHKNNVCKAKVTRGD